MGALDGKIAIVTGGGTGIGYGIAKRFIDEGAEVTIVGRRQARLDEAQARLAAIDPKVAGSMTGWHLAKSRLAAARGDQDLARTALEAAQRCMNSVAVADHIHRQYQQIERPA